MRIQRSFSLLCGFASALAAAKGHDIEARDPIPITNNVLHLARHTKNLAHLNRRDSAVHSTDLFSIGGGLYFSSALDIGTPPQTLHFVVDTGSSDFYVAGPHLTCLNHTTNRNTTDCGLPHFDPAKSTSFRPVEDQHFAVSYGGELTFGTFANETISFAGLTVDQQQVAIATYQDDVEGQYYENSISGFIGLGYAPITYAWEGTDLTDNPVSKRRHYTPIFTNMVERNLTSPIFSIAFDKNISEPGILGLGGVPASVKFGQSEEAMVRVPMNVGEGVEAPDDKYRDYGRYSFNITGYSMAGVASDAGSAKDNSTDPNSVTGVRFPYEQAQIYANGTTAVVDSATPNILVDPKIAKAYLDLFGPVHSVYNSSSKGYLVDCNGDDPDNLYGLKVPRFGVEVGGKRFDVDPSNLVYPGTPDNKTCFVAIQPKEGGRDVLGLVWMFNLLSIFDQEKHEMSFTYHLFD